MNEYDIVIVGAGPGGLASAMMLASQGYNVHVFEKQDYVGGRNGHFSLGKYTFDIGPTFLSMPHIVEEIFQFFWGGHKFLLRVHYSPSKSKK